MAQEHSDALVLFGASGDLAAKTLFPALYALVAQRRISVPIIGVARRRWDRGQFVDHVRESIESKQLVDTRAFSALAEQLKFVDGDLRDDATFEKLRSALQGAPRPLYYLAIPPDLVPMAAHGLARAGCAGARLAVEKPFGHDLASARALNDALRRVFDEREIFRVDHYLAKPSLHALRALRANPVLQLLWRREHIRCVQITMAEDFGVETRGGFYDRVGALRDVVQNHVLQVLAILAMELPHQAGEDAMHAARIGLLESVSPIDPGACVRGQYDGYRRIQGVEQGSDTETFIAFRLAVDNERWRDVPFYIRAGKRMPVTATEAWIELRSAAPLSHAVERDRDANALRFRLGPGAVQFGFRARIGDVLTRQPSQDIELVADRGEEYDRDAYEHLLADALSGDRLRFERETGVEAAWRIVEPLLQSPPRAEQYSPDTWGPRGAEAILLAGDRWHDPLPPSAQDRCP